MRLERLTLAPYGRFADCTLNLRPDASLHVVLGANESGKTTALAAIGDLLYGFPLRTDYGFRFEMSALRIGGAIRLADGAGLEFRRRKGRGATLVDADDRPISDAPLLAALGGVDRQTFEMEFGLTAQALREGGRALLAASGGLAETLAASSAGLSALVKLRETLAAEADALFTPRKSAGKAFYVALEAYDAADKKLRDAIVTADALKAAEQKRAEAENAEQRLREEFDDAGRILAKRERASRTHAMLARLAALAAELESFADLPEIDAASLAAARQALDDDRALQAGLARLAAEAEAEAADIATLVLDAEMLAAGDAVDALREKLGAVRKAGDDLPRRIEARDQALAQLDDVARRLGLADHHAALAAPPSDAARALARQAIDDRREAMRRLDDDRARARDAAAKRDQLAAGAAEAVDRPRAAAPPAGAARRAPGRRRAAEQRARRPRSRRRAGWPRKRRVSSRRSPISTRWPARSCPTLRNSPHSSKPTSSASRRARRRSGITNRPRAMSRRRRRRWRNASARRRARRAAEWLAARERRNGALDRLGVALDEDATRRRDAFDAARALTLAADAVGDAVVANSERAARLEAAREDLASRREALERAEREARASVGGARGGGGGMARAVGALRRRAAIAGGDGALDRSGRSADQAPRRMARPPRRGRRAGSPSRPSRSELAAVVRGDRSGPRRRASRSPIARRAPNWRRGRRPGRRPARPPTRAPTPPARLRKRRRRRRGASASWPNSPAPGRRRCAASG